MPVSRAMEDVLEIHGREYGGDSVLVRAGETSRPGQRRPCTLPVRPGRPAGRDCEYGPGGTADRRTGKGLADTHFPDRDITRVSDDPDTRRLPALHGTFVPGEASRLAGRLDIHHAPKHGSRLNMAKTATGVLSRQFLDRRIPDRETPMREVGAWEAHRGAPAKPVNWRFRTGNARIRPKSPYPSIR